MPRPIQIRHSAPPSGSRSSADTSPRSVTAEGRASCPLSPAQRRIWLADRRQPGNSAYNCAFRWLLDGPLKIGALERAFNEILRRHDILRARFNHGDAGPLQSVAADA